MQADRPKSDSGEGVLPAAHPAGPRYWKGNLHTHSLWSDGDDFPEMIRISNAASTPERYREGARHWHSDSSYEPVPASVTMLYCAESPNVGGETLFASSALAYDALDPETKAQIDDRVGLHCLGGSPGLPGEKIPFVPEETARMGIVKHPLNLAMQICPQRPLLRVPEQFFVGHAAPQEVRQARRQFIFVEQPIACLCRFWFDQE